jgi:hypothetical protein
MVTHDAKAAGSAKRVLHLEKGDLLERDAATATHTLPEVRREAVAL